MNLFLHIVITENAPEAIGIRTPFLEVGNQCPSHPAAVLIKAKFVLKYKILH
jgi:hypothetical protein